MVVGGGRGELGRGGGNCPLMPHKRGCTVLPAQPLLTRDPVVIPQSPTDGTTSPSIAGCRSSVLYRGHYKSQQSRLPFFTEELQLIILGLKVPSAGTEVWQPAMLALGVP